MPCSIKTKEKCSPFIERAAKNLNEGLYSSKELILAEIRKDRSIKFSDNAIFETLPYIRKKAGIAFKGGKPSDYISDEEYLQSAKRSRAEKHRSKDFKDKEKYLLSEIEKLEKEIAVVLKIKNTPQTIKVEAETKRPSDSTAEIILSDWHLEEEVVEEKVSGLNKYNLEIADLRIKNCINRSIQLIDIFSNETKIKDTVINLLGDFITGNIHEDNIESCLLSPIDASWKAYGYLCALIDAHLQRTDKNLLIPCHSGNHARTTKKQMIANEAGHSLEYLIYKMLAEHYAKNKRISMIVAEGYHSYLNLRGFQQRNHHGHAFNYNGGIGGITIPIIKKIAKWNEAKTVDLTINGHLHQFFKGTNFISNGSIIGFNSFAIFIGAGYEKPKQTAFLVNHKHNEVTMHTPIFVE